MKSAIKTVSERFTVCSEQDGLALAGIAVYPENMVPTAVLQISHGMIEHKERYLPFMQWMAEHGVACVIHDHRGHGESVFSPAELGYFGENGGDALVRDLYQVTGWAKRRFGRLPFFLLGHSMGSLAARAYVRHYGRALDGLIVCGSPSRRTGASSAERILGRLTRDEHRRNPKFDRAFSNFFERPYRSENLPYAWICSDRAVVEAHNEDPLCTFTFTVNGYRSLFWLMHAAYDMPRDSAACPDLPVRFISGADDVCLISRRRFADAVETMRRAGYRNVTARLFPGMRHEILLESGCLRVYHDILRFITPNAGIENAQPEADASEESK